MRRVRAVRLLAVYVPLAFVTIAALAVSQGWLGAQRTMDRHVEAQREQARRVTALVLATWRASVAPSLAKIAGSPRFLAAVAEGDDDAAGRSLQATSKDLPPELDLVLFEREGAVVAQARLGRVADVRAIGAALAGHDDPADSWRFVESGESRALVLSSPVLDDETGRVLGYLRGGFFVDSKSAGLRGAIREATGASWVELGGAPRPHAFRFEAGLTEEHSVRVQVALSTTMLDELRASRARTLAVVVAGSVALLLGVMWILFRVFLPSLREVLRYAEAVRAGQPTDAFHAERDTELSVVGVAIEEAVTALRAQQQRAESSHRSFEGLVVAAAHCLRTPLVTIGGLSGLVTEALTDEQAAELADVTAKIAAQIQLMGQMLSHLRDLAEVGELANAEPVDFAALLVAAAAAQGVGVEPVAGPLVVADRSALTRAAEALVLYAVARSRGATPQMSVSVEPGERTARFVVADDGRALSGDERRRALDRFFDAGVDDGVGVGLAFVRRVVEVFGGRVELEDPPAGGLAVAITLPAARGDAGPHPILDGPGRSRPT